MTRPGDVESDTGNPLLTCDNGQSGTGRCANTDPLLDRINLVVEGSGPVAILPEVQSSVSNPLEISRMSRVDGCPEACGNAEAPYRTEDTEHGFRGYYGCETCGQFWTTDWRD